MNPTHPVRVSSGQIVVDRDHVYALASKSIQVHRKGRHEGLSFTGLHFCDPTEVQGSSAHHLDVVMTLADLTLGRFTHRRERLNHDVFEIGAIGQLLPKGHRAMG